MCLLYQQHLVFNKELYYILFDLPSDSPCDYTEDHSLPPVGSSHEKYFKSRSNVLVINSFCKVKWGQGRSQVSKTGGQNLELMDEPSGPLRPTKIVKSESFCVWCKLFTVRTLCNAVVAKEARFATPVDAVSKNVTKMP